MHFLILLSEGKMCAIKEVTVSSDDQALKESLRQLNQVTIALCRSFKFLVPAD